MKDSNKIAFNTGITYARMLITVFISLYTSRIVLLALGVSDFGIFNIVAGVVALFSFINGSMTVSTQRFLSYEIGRKDQVAVNKIFNASILVHSVIALVILVLAETAGLWFFKHYLNIPGNRKDAALLVYQFAIVSFMLNILNVPFQALLNAKENLLAIAVINIIETIFRLGAALLLTFTLFDKLVFFGFSTFLIALFSLGLYIAVCLIKYQESKIYIVKDIKLYKELLSFAGWNLFGAIAGVGKSQGNAILLNIFFGPVLNAAYAIANQVNGQLSFFAQSIFRATNPQIVKNYGEGNKDHMLRLIYQASKFAFFILFLFALPIMLRMDYVLLVWLKKVPSYAPLFCQLILINTLIDLISYPLMTAAQSTGRIKYYQMFMGLFVLLNFPFSYLLFHFGFPPYSIIICNISISFIALFFRLLFLKSMINFPIGSWVKECFSKILILTLVVAISSVLANKLIGIGFYNFIILSAFSAIVSIITFYILLDKDEKNYMKKLFTRLYSMLPISKVSMSKL